MTASFPFQTTAVSDFYLRVMFMISSAQPRGIVLLNTSTCPSACTCMGASVSVMVVERGYFMNENDVH